MLPAGHAFKLDSTSLEMLTGVLFLANAYNVPLDFSGIKQLCRPADRVSSLVPIS